MEFTSKETVTFAAFTTLGILFGVVGNLMVVSFYRIADRLGYTSGNWDMAVFVVSAVIIYAISYFFYRELFEQKTN